MADWNGSGGDGNFVDPAAVDNSAIVTIPLEPPSTAGTPTGSDASGQPDVAALSARLAEMEAVQARHAQQQQGARQEAQRLQAELQTEREANRRANEQHQQFMQQLMTQRAQPQAEPEPPMSLADVIEKVALNGDKDAARRFEQQFLRQREQQAAQAPAQSAEKPLTTQQVYEMMQERDRVTRLRDAMVQDLGSRYKDVLDHPQASEMLSTAYAQAQQNPLLAAISHDPTGIATLEWGGQRWNVHLLERAAQEVRTRLAQSATQQQQNQDTVQHLPQQGGGANNGRPQVPRESVVAPRGMVELLKDPRIARAFETLTGHKDPRTQLKDVFEHVPQDVRQGWQRQAALSQQELQRR